MAVQTSFESSSEYNQIRFRNPKRFTPPVFLSSIRCDKWLALLTKSTAFPYWFDGSRHTVRKVPARPSLRHSKCSLPSSCETEHIGKWRTANGQENARCHATATDATLQRIKSTTTRSCPCSASLLISFSILPSSPDRPCHAMPLAASHARLPVEVWCGSPRFQA